MTTDSHLFRTQEALENDHWILKGNVFYKGNEKYLPLYEGKMIWYFDHRFGMYNVPTEYLADNGRLPELTEAQHFDPFYLPMPHYWIHQQHMPDFIQFNQQALIVFRLIARAADFRSAIFSLIPTLPCGNSLPVITMNMTNTREIAFLAASASSFVFDYIARQKLGGTNMNFLYLNNFLYYYRINIPCYASGIKVFL